MKPTQAQQPEDKNNVLLSDSTMAALTNRQIVFVAVALLRPNHPTIAAYQAAYLLHYTTIHHITVYYSTLQYTTLQYTTVHYSTLQYTTLLYTTLHYNTPHYCILHYITVTTVNNSIHHITVYTTTTLDHIRSPNHITQTTISVNKSSLPSVSRLDRLLSRS